MQQLNLNLQQQLQSKDDMIKNLQGTIYMLCCAVRDACIYLYLFTRLNSLEQIIMWKNKYEALAKLYSQLRQEHIELLNKFKAAQLKANSAQEAIDKMERMERDVKAKNLELADMIRERDRARHELDRLKGVSFYLLVDQRQLGKKGGGN